MTPRALYEERRTIPRATQEQPGGVGPAGDGLVIHSIGSVDLRALIACPIDIASAISFHN